MGVAPGLKGETWGNLRLQMQLQKQEQPQILRLPSLRYGRSDDKLISHANFRDGMTSYY